MKKSALILDCYVDEPACLGVPPFISPYPRYIYGALIHGGISEDQVKYLTIDSLRDSDYQITEYFDIVFVIGGAVVPGRYLGAKIGRITEIEKIIQINEKFSFVIGGMISTKFSNDGVRVTSIKGDIEKYASTFAQGNPVDSFRTVDEISAWSKIGSEIIRHHPYFPNIICEIETSRGCPREQHCTFCSEGLYKKIEFRDEEDIIGEIDELISKGADRFRLGRQADILQYKSKLDHFENGFSRPNIQSVKSLFGELQKRKEDGRIKILNIDNANPGTIFNFQKESSLILESIVNAITPGDTLALGIESFDPVVVKKNNLKVLNDEALIVIDIINGIGSKRINGIPVLLPGINLIHGLYGETDKSFKENFIWLEKIRDMGLLVKRINIRKLLPFPGTGLFNKPEKISKRTANRFDYYKKMIRNEIDVPMVKMIYPSGTIIRDSIVLENHSGYSLGKQISSYSMTTKFPMELEINKFYDAVVVNHRERSLITLPVDCNINTLEKNALQLIPGISSRKASEIVLKRPLKTFEELKDIAPDISKNISQSIKFE